MKNKSVREALVLAGVKNLKEFGYPAVSTENILTDRVYSAFFLSILADNRGHGFDKEIDALIASIKKSDDLDWRTV